MTQNSNTLDRPTEPDASLAAKGAPQKPRRGKGLALAGASVAMLAGSVWLNRALARRAESATPPSGMFVEVDGVRLHYVDKGLGPAVVLLHGNGASLNDFEASGLLGFAAEHHRVIAFDRPGFGYSERPRETVWTPGAQAELIAQALSKLGVERSVVVGHSWGTLVALALGLDHPGLVSGLVLLSGYYYPTARPDVILPLPVAVPIIGDLLANTVAPLTGLLTSPAAVKASFAPAEVPEKFSAFPVALGLRPSQMRATAADTALMIPGAHALSRRYGELNLPVIIMAGEGDLIVHVQNHSSRLVQDLQKAELEVVPNQGHMFHYAVPERIVAAIDRLGHTRGDAPTY